jgi:hypothetical protein
MKAKIDKIRLSKLSRELLDDFDDCAQSRGWEKDQGIGRDVKKAEIEYKETKLALAKRLFYLENKVKRLKYISSLCTRM